MKKRLKYAGLFFVIILVCIFLLLLFRYFSSRQIDDVSPEIQCDNALLKKADILYVIPIFNNSSISENKEWCDSILSLNKTLAMHGVYHTYHEFLEDRNEAYLQQGIGEFEKCFGKKPDRFKPPQMVISKNNKELIKKDMKLNFYLNEIFHKTYHCSDTGKYSNKFIEIF
ncbi:hypothetical protein A3K73_03980 [Candidatus Pacearchaeota archaeon RBG_13_36_9]|nr:MAG: hypothetical protein A3K73_03980 [Candidatus Pacearchaeota archaeon RBG_13_36_9]